MKLKKESIGNFIKAVVFLSILFSLFFCFTYLFRNTGNTTRGNILEYMEEEENSLDVVFVGASNINVYWDPMRAWNEYGFTSRNYAPTGMQGPIYFAAVQSALRTQKPKLLVVEARMFAKDYSEVSSKVAARHLLDSIDYDLFRLKHVKYYSDIMDLTWEEALTFYIDLMQYHDNYSALLNPTNWKLADNRLGKANNFGNLYKGYMLNASHVIFQDPSENLSDESKEVDETVLKVYTDIIEYCKEEDIPLLFVASPIVVTKAFSERFNGLAEVAESYGVDFLDTNRLYDEMGIDFTQDFYNARHVNALGANKFTDYVAAYLTENYDLPDHRGDSNYEDWNELYKKYIRAKERTLNKLIVSVEAYEKTVETQQKMQQAQEPAEWVEEAKNSEIAVLAVANKSPAGLSEESRKVLKELGARESYLDGTKAVLQVLYNNGVQYSATDKEDKEGKIGSEEIRYRLSTDGKIRLSVEGENYYDTAKGGIQMLAVNLRSGEVFDKVYLSVAEDGSLTMSR